MTAVKGGERAAVLFADLVGGARVAECSQALEAATRAGGGELIKKMGEGVMASFPTPDAAAAAATQMHSAVSALLTPGEAAPALRIGFHAGPVIRRDGDVFGDTVNLAARLTHHAARGQILTSRETARLLSPALRNATRALYEVEVKGKSEKVELWEVLWQQSPDITDLSEHRHAAAAARLRLRRHGAEIGFPEEGLAIGRDPACQVVIDDEHVSRRHCTIRSRHGKFLLQDHSANGTYLAIDGEADITLHREDYVLRGHGWISFGQPRAEAAELLEFFCD
jgi:adenylate cyclase